MIRGAVRAVDSMMAIVKIFLVILFALFFPRIFLYYVTYHTTRFDDHLSFKLGLENINTDFLKQLTSSGDLSYAVGLITNQTGKDQKGRFNIEVLQEKGLTITKIFTPEHGFVDKQNITDKNIPIISLYGKTGPKKLTKEILDDIQVLIFDIQDAGICHDSYLTTLLQVIEASAQYHKPLVVLDRPNLLGSVMEGTLISGMQNTDIPIPVRYGMTIGEVASYFNQQIVSQPALLYVVQMCNYDRKIWPETLSCNLSPDIVTRDSCYGYSFLGLIGEVAPFDIGVGTDKAFQCILLPESIKFPQKKWYELQIKLKKIGVHSLMYRYFSKRKNEYCKGLRLYIANIGQFSSFNGLLTILQFFKKTGLPITFSKNFDRALGTNQVRALLNGKIEQKTFEMAVNKELKSFFNRASASFLYKPVPKIMMV